MTFRYVLFVVLSLAMTALLSYGTYTTNRLLRTWVPDRNLLLLPGETLHRGNEIRYQVAAALELVFHFAPRGVHLLLLSDERVSLADIDKHDDDDNQNDDRHRGDPASASLCHVLSSD